MYCVCSNGSIRSQRSLLLTWSPFDASPLTKPFMILLSRAHRPTTIAWATIPYRLVTSLQDFFFLKLWNIFRNALLICKLLAVHLWEKLLINSKLFTLQKNLTRVHLWGTFPSHWRRVARVGYRGLSLGLRMLTQGGQDKMAAIFLTTQTAKFMGPTWVMSAPDGPHVGPMNLAIRGHFQIFLNENVWFHWNLFLRVQLTIFQHRFR